MSSEVDLTPADEARFWSKVEQEDDEDCWHWIGTLHNQGYGVFFLHKSKRSTVSPAVKAHRVMWRLAYGYWPLLYICHNCHNPPCVNPFHLREDTHAGNMHDSISIGTFNSYRRRLLTPDQVALIRACPSVQAARALTAGFNVTHATIWGVWHRRIYKELP